MPARVLEWSGVARPSDLGPLGWVGTAVALGGAAVALWSVLSFAVVGRGTPAPFDPPRRLVVRGPFRFVRNPMYLGSGAALVGASMVFRSPALLGYAVAYAIGAHVFVVGYEEPTLTRLFGAPYNAYRSRVRRWLPSA
jgi:protein-S-isoprenylcysteine O-methyltransferase Ste14